MATPEKRRRNVSISDAGSALRAVLLISAVVMAVMLILGGLYLLRGNSEKGESKTDGDVQRYFSELIEEYEMGMQELPLEIPEMDLEEALILYSTAHSSYYQECDVIYEGNDGQSSKIKKQIIKDCDRFFIRSFDGNTLTETIKCDGERVLVINEVTGRTSILSAKDNCLCQLAGLPCHENVAAEIEKFLADKSSSALSKCSCSLKRAKAMNSLVLDVSYKDTGISEKYYYYLDYGLIYQCDSYYTSGGNRTGFYKMTTTAFSSDISEYVSEDSFKIE